MTLQPAYGRDYKSGKEAKIAFYSNRDWITDMFHGSAVANHEDLQKTHLGQSVQLRFKRNTGVTVAKVLTEAAALKELEKLQRPKATKPVATPVAEAAAKPFDSLGFIMDYEGGTITEDDAVAGFQHLIDTGMAWTLQGSYGRTAMALIEQGLCTRKA